MQEKPDGMPLLCENFCAYYKPGKNEELSCEGFRVVRRLLREGKPISLEKRGGGPERTASRDALRATICTNCTFSEADCDYCEAGKEAPPCGGFVLLHRLLDAGEIAVEDL